MSYHLIIGRQCGEGSYFNTKVQMLWDSGCSSAAVRSSLVQPDQMTGNVHACVLIAGTIGQFPIAKIKVDTQFYTGDVEAMCI